MNDVTTSEARAMVSSDSARPWATARARAGSGSHAGVSPGEIQAPCSTPCEEDLSSQFRRDKVARGGQETELQIDGLHVIAGCDRSAD